jgi:hypothetical protein
MVLFSVAVAIRIRTIVAGKEIGKAVGDTDAADIVVAGKAASVEVAVVVDSL